MTIIVKPRKISIDASRFWWVTKSENLFSQFAHTLATLTHETWYTPFKNGVGHHLLRRTPVALEVVTYAIMFAFNSPSRPGPARTTPLALNRKTPPRLPAAPCQFVP
jgi:hypothetical protein